MTIYSFFLRLVGPERASTYRQVPINTFKSLSFHTFKPSFKLEAVEG